MPQTGRRARPRARGPHPARTVRSCRSLRRAAGSRASRPPPPACPRRAPACRSACAPAGASRPLRGARGAARPTATAATLGASRRACLGCGSALHGAIRLRPSASVASQRRARRRHAAACRKPDGKHRRACPGAPALARAVGGLVRLVHVQVLRVGHQPPLPRVLPRARDLPARCPTASMESLSRSPPAGQQACRRRAGPSACAQGSVLAVAGLGMCCVGWLDGIGLGYTTPICWTAQAAPQEDARVCVLLEERLAHVRVLQGVPLALHARRKHQPCRHTGHVRSPVRLAGARIRAPGPPPCTEGCRCADAAGQVATAAQPTTVAAPSTCARLAHAAHPAPAARRWRAGRGGARTAECDPLLRLQRLDEHVHDDVLRRVRGGELAGQLEVPDDAWRGRRRQPPFRAGEQHHLKGAMYWTAPISAAVSAGAVAAPQCVRVTRGGAHRASRCPRASARAGPRSGSAASARARLLWQRPAAACYISAVWRIPDPGAQGAQPLQSALDRHRRASMLLRHAES